MAAPDESGNQVNVPDAARARVRLALQAERAWGVTALPGTGTDLLRTRTAAVESPETAPEPASRAASRRGGGSVQPSPRPAAPPAGSPDAKGIDLFGRSGAGTAPSVGEACFEAPPPPVAQRIELLQSLDENEVAGCTKCGLHEGRTRTVFGEGSPEARLMFIGEGPGENEDRTGRPFVGRAGELLNKMIAGMGLAREQVYIANVVKCRPPNNRVPTAVEVGTCTPYLHQQVEWIRPEVIVTLGLPATRHLLKSRLSMGKLRGQWHEWRGIRVMPTYHPAYLLRSYTESNRRTVWSDLQQVMEVLGLRSG